MIGRVVRRAPGRGLWLGLAVLASLGRPAAGQSGARLPSGALRDGSHQYQIVVAPGWRPIPAPEGTLVTYRAPSGRAQLAITRVEIGTRRASSPAALAAEVERGVERATPGFRRLRRKAGDTRGVATLDLWYERGGRGPALVLSRYLFFNRYTVVLSIGLAANDRADRRAAESMARSFSPFLVP